MAIESMPTPAGVGERRSTILLVAGTRPEAIKIAPVVTELLQSPVWRPSICFTAQHRGMLDQVIETFRLPVGYDLNLMQPNQDLTSLTSETLRRMREVIIDAAPTIVLVQGDTTTAMAAALAAFYERVPVAHLEAGLRTGRRDAPWPEEVNRRLITVLAELHFAATAMSRDNLLAEGVDPESVHVTGNTVIDALGGALRRLEDDGSLRDRLASRFGFLAARRRLLLVTMHRREHFGYDHASVCAAVATLAGRHDIDIIFPVHPNPMVHGPVHRALSAVPRVHLTEPLDYLEFVFLMQQAHLILSDSGGVQEEAPSVGTPVLVLRDTTERPEGVIAGTSRIVGTDQEAIVREVERLLEHEDAHATMRCAVNPYGDGRASARVVEHLTGWLRRPGREGATPGSCVRSAAVMAAVRS